MDNFKLLLFVVLLFPVALTAQDGFVVASYDDANTQSSWSAGQVFARSFLDGNYANEGLQQAFLYRGADTLLYENNNYPVTYRPAVRRPGNTNPYMVNSAGLTDSLYLLPTQGLDSLIEVMAYGVKFSNDTELTAPYSVPTLAVDLHQPTIYPDGSVPPVQYNNNAPEEFLVGINTPVRWYFSVANRELVDTQWVNVKYPPCAELDNIVDGNGNHYDAVRIGYYCWTKQNMRADKYTDGVNVPNPMIYANNAEYYNRYGYLYNWNDAVRAPLTPDANGYVQGVCPSGWRVPSADEFDYLNHYSSYDLMATTDWLNGVGTNTTEFTALPAGIFTGVRYENLLGETSYWTSTSIETGWANYCSLQFGCSEVLTSTSIVSAGKSVRCLKN